jgi:hypothetical protein
MRALARPRPTDLALSSRGVIAASSRSYLAGRAIVLSA